MGDGGLGWCELGGGGDKGEWRWYGKGRTVWIGGMVMVMEIEMVWIGGMVMVMVKKTGIVSKDR